MPTKILLMTSLISQADREVVEAMIIVIPIAKAYPLQCFTHPVAEQAADQLHIRGTREITETREECRSASAVHLLFRLFSTTSFAFGAAIVDTRIKINLQSMFTERPPARFFAELLRTIFSAVGPSPRQICLPVYRYIETVERRR